MRKFNKKIIVLFIIILFIPLLYLLDSEDKEYKKTLCKDNAWEIILYRKKTFFGLGGVEVRLMVFDEKENILFNKVIDNRDVWEDVEIRYNDLVCNKYEIKVGPMYWDKNKEKFSYLLLNKSELESKGSDSIDINP